MKKGIRIFAAAVLGLALAACSSAEKMAQQAENVTVKCTPVVLEAVAGNVDAQVAVTYPKDYFHPKAILEVTPVLVYEGGEAKGKTLMYQGEKVKDNYKVVPTAGTTVSEKLHFDYVEGMENSHLELRGVARYGKKSVNLPVKKVADGVNTTYMLVKREGQLAFKKDNYQSVIKQTAEGQILYQVNSSEVQSKQLSSQSVKDFQAALDEIAANERKTITGTEVVAYASPEGGEKLNAKLSDNRSKTGEKAFEKITKGKEVGSPEVRSIGQDWEGFQELVQNSDIEDKDLILRVLSMYSDPAVRESEIKNMSNVYTDLKSSVLPELRRARFIANVEFKNYTADELLKLVDENSDVLDETSLLHAATLVKDQNDKVKLYNKAIDKYDSDVARYNLAATYFNNDELSKAENALSKVEDKDADYENALGAIALRKGNYDEALKHFKNSGTNAAQTNIGILDILQGNYSKAVQDIKDTKGCCSNRTLAYILNGQLDKAEAEVSCNHGKANYLRAIIAARKGNASDVKKYLGMVQKQDKALYERSQTDIEFAEYR